jgi:hypothetical protein
MSHDTMHNYYILLFRGKICYLQIKTVYMYALLIIKFLFL